MGYPELHGDVVTDDDTARRRLAGAAVRDDRTVQITLRAPQADFLRVFTSPLTAPVSEKAAEADPSGFARDPVCVGPYRLEKPYAPGGTSLMLVRSRSYNGVDASLTEGGRSYADAVEFRFFPDAEAAAAAQEIGEVDAAPARPAGSLGLKTRPGPDVEYIGLPTTSAGFREPAVRRALSLALDREALVQVVFPGTRFAADGFLPGTAPADDRCAASPVRADVGAARSLLAEVGADLAQMRVPLYFNDELRNRALVEEVARQWRESVGLVATPTPLSFADYVARGEGRPGFDGPFRFSWSIPFADLDGYLFPLFTTDRIGRDNFGRFSEPAIDEAIIRGARRAQDPDDRSLAYKRVTELLCEAMPMIPLTTSSSRWSVADHVGTATGSYIDSATGQPLLRELYLR